MKYHKESTWKPYAFLESTKISAKIIESVLHLIMT